MRRIRSSNTKPERIVCRLLWSMGYRYRLHRKDLPGKPDVTFVGRKKVVFVHGCFWHQHGEECTDSHLPKSNLTYWLPKLQRNQERDKAAQQALVAAGWRVLVIWDCETKSKELAERLQAFMEH
ncbi:MAG: DNA mismatch endonuclease Vsr [Candidimonas sp.]|nr:MAG: DNA mismatch endonuclease Vsr [Candidimonas sp.]